jgi:hypothetical protein
MSAHVRTITGLVVGIACAIMLSGCSLLAPIRDADGAILKETELASAELLVGDCFTFVDGTDHSMATVVPCEDSHAYIVIGQGTLTTAAIDSSGGLQNAVSAACEGYFDTFVASAPEGADPDQEFIVSAEEDDDGVTTTLYSCLATDGESVAAGAGA